MIKESSYIDVFQSDVYQSKILIDEGTSFFPPRGRWANQKGTIYKATIHNNPSGM